MLRARIMKLQGNDNYKEEEQAAFQLLRDGLLEAVAGKTNHPKLNVYSDQIVWARSPVRIDVAGGWTDTPPYSLYSGGSVVNLAIEPDSLRCKYTSSHVRNSISYFVLLIWEPWKLSEATRNYRITKKSVHLSPFQRQHLPWQDSLRYSQRNLTHHWKST